MIKQNTSKPSMQVRIEATSNQRIYVDHFDDGVWINILHDAGSTNAVLTNEQAKNLISALIRIVDDGVNK